MTETVTDVAIDAVLVGPAAPLGTTGVRSGIAKTPRAHPAAVGLNGLDGDEQADRRYHGGPEKAVHHYAFDHYAGWRRDLPETEPSLLARPGAFGENLSSSGLTEHDICVGDLWRVGSALLQVSQARQPCWKLNHRFGAPDMARRVQTSGRTGWYYRVVEPGMIAAGDRLCLIERPHPAWPLARLLRAFYVDRLDRDALAGIADLDALSPSWRALARRRLERGVVEDWTPRLESPGG
ncbi:MOSC domain-containing protein [Methylobacterium pseudosasicola]|uniref:MOSC domain-containing protein YiiM n=1 Tax=Methylobacterium pseudosasicola TaxID=582667 RepID=A0A1I4F1J5_9HYPH|nr:MOSC domain-containing protein [Methylobacterium pseudosasicola]SFL11784.1 MOSC domain-containing protein YiiM [Methylobacterium pseudosasicola]